MTDYRVMLDVQILPEDFQEMMSVDLADELTSDPRALSPVTIEDKDKTMVGATFGVWAHDVLDALVLGRGLLLEALERMGVQPPMVITYAEVVPYDRCEEIDLPGRVDSQQAAALDPA